MSWNISTKGSSGSTIPLLDDDMYNGVCVWMIDLGTQKQEYQGDTRIAHKVFFAWAIEGETVDIDGEAKPRIVSKEYTLSLHERATLRKDLEGWRGASFDAEGLDAFDISKVLKKSCRLLVGKTGTGKSNKVEAIKKAKGEVQVPDGIEVIFFRLDEWDGGELPEAIPNWIKDKIKGSPEYAAKAGEQEPQPKEAPADESDEDDFPF